MRAIRLCVVTIVLIAGSSCNRVEQPSSNQSGTPAVTRSGQSPISVVPHTVVNDEVSETPGKTQVKQDLIVDANISEADLRSLLQDRYEEASKRAGFRYHEHPTVVAIYAYPSRDHLESGMGQWSGMLSKGPTDTVPVINIHSSVGEGSGEEERFGLSEARRREIYTQLIQAEDRGQSEAEQEYPNAYESMDLLMKQSELASELSNNYRQELANKLGLTSDQLRAIGEEGLRNNWPMPKL